MAPFKFWVVIVPTHTTFMHLPFQPFIVYVHNHVVTDPWLFVV